MILQLGEKNGQELNHPKSPNFPGTENGGLPEPYIGGGFSLT